jgi:arsenite methyltransferase
MDKKADELRELVQRRYGSIASGGEGASGGCCCGASSCWGGGPAMDAEQAAFLLGYADGDTEGMPDMANMGLGCGNPVAIAGLKAGETVLDLGSGGGFDCFLARRQVGASGRVIGVDMTPEMIRLARKNARESGYDNVEFRLGEIEHLPVADASVDAVISNCVINLSPEKAQVLSEAFRVLRPGGRVSVSDVVATAPLPPDAKEDLALYAGCIAGAEYAEDIRAMLEDAGFADIRMEPRDNSREIIGAWAPGRRLEDFVASFIIEALKPA